MTWRIWSPVGSTSSSNASFETSFSPDAHLLWTKSNIRLGGLLATALRDEEHCRLSVLGFARSGSDVTIAR
jgi:hypothetical protein